LAQFCDVAQLAAIRIEVYLARFGDIKNMKVKRKNS
jgi:hypothetical protein